MATKATVRWLVAGEILLVIIALAIPAPMPYSLFGDGWGAGKWEGQTPLLGWPLLMFGIAALGFIVYNLAQRKGQPLAVLFPSMLAVYCLFPIAYSLFGYFLSNFSKTFLPYLIPYIAGWLLLMRLETGTHKFIRDCDQPLAVGSKGDGAKPEAVKK